MKYSEFKSLIEMSEVFFPKAGTLPNTKIGMEVWFNELKEFDYNILSRGLRDYARTNQFPPRLCNFIDFGMAANEPEYPEPEQAWSILYKAICNSGYHAEEEFTKLPKYLQEAAGSPWNLKAMAATDEETLNRTDKINFLISYKTIIKHYKENSRKTAATQSNVQKLNAGSDRGRLDALIDKAVHAVESPQMPYNPFLQLKATNVPESEKGMPEMAIAVLEAYTKENYNMDYTQAVNVLKEKHAKDMVLKTVSLEG